MKDGTSTSTAELPPPPSELHEFFGSPTLQDESPIAKAPAVDTSTAMTVRGSTVRASILFAFALAAAALTWALYDAGASVVVFVWGGLAGGLVITLLLASHPERAQLLAIPYAICEGALLGALSATLDEQMPGVVRSSAVATVLVCAMVLLVARLMPRQLSPRVWTGVTIATLAIAGLYVIDLIASAFGASVVFLHESGGWAVIVSVIIVLVACANLLLDIDFIRYHSDRGAPKSLEWYAAWSLMVTVVWIYIEILRLILLMSGDDD